VQAARREDAIVDGMAASGPDDDTAARAPGRAQKVAAPAAERAEGKAGKVQERLNEALRKAVARVESEPGNVEAIISYLGWDGRHLRHGDGSESAPAENAEQIVNRAVRRLRESGVVPDAVERSIALAERSLPILEWDLCAALLNAKLCFVRISCDALASAAAVFRKEPPFELVRIGPVEGLVKAGTRGSVSELAATAQSLTRSDGCANVSDLLKRAYQLFGPNTTLAFVEAVARTVPRFEWLDRDTGWFWYRPESVHSKNRLVSQIKRIMAAAPSLPLRDLRNAIRRDYRLGMSAPPLDVVSRVCKRLLFLQVDNDTVTRVASSVPWNAVLDPEEAVLASVLQAHGPVLNRGDFLDRCRERGMNETTFLQATSHSAILKSPAPGMYALIGTTMPEHAPEAPGAESRGEMSEIADHGCLPDGRVFLAWRLSSSALASGALRVPEPLSTFIEGDYKLATFDGRELGAIQVHQRTCWDVRPLLEMEHSEVGDTLAMVLDPRDRRAAGILGAENVIAAVTSGYLELEPATADKRGGRTFVPPARTATIPKGMQPSSVEDLAAGFRRLLTA
jgi:hypothetical protein